jgi:NADPH:quinone reductase-like Zn-dependent oxidoreductase
MSLLEAAALPEVTCTVWSMVFDRGRLLPGEVLLVHGGTRRVGTMAIQLATRYGATVAVTAGSPAKLAVCAGLGAHILVDYREEDFVARVREATAGHGADVILDNMGAAYLGRNLAALSCRRASGVARPAGRHEGRARSRPADERARQRHCGEPAGPATGAESGDRRGHPCLRLARAGACEVRPIVDSVFDLADVAAAHRRVESSNMWAKSCCG